jgi:DNA-binding response OmpR family regulator
VQLRLSEENSGVSVLKFLVVDDATFIRDLLKKNLRDNFPGTEIIDASSAKKAQQLLKTNRVDLILCDWEMPEMTGEDFLHWIRASEEYADLPFIMVTSRGERDFIVKAVQAGVSDYLGKPFKPELLVSKVIKALKKVGKEATGHASNHASGFSSASLEVLTKSTDSASSAAADKSALQNPSAPSLTAAPAKKKPASRARGQAQLTFAGFSSTCVISDISLQLLTGAIKREAKLPSILEPAVISIVQNDGEDVARLNGYVHSLQAGENRIDAGVLKVQIRFVDDDPDKLDQLSRYIATLQNR